MACYDFFLKQQYCNVHLNPYVGNKTCTPNEETWRWFNTQGIRLYTGHESQIGVICTALDITEDQALLIQLAFDIQADTQELYDK